MGYQLGVDLGTTYTAAAVCRSSGRGWVEPEVVTLGTRSATVPSVLFVAPDDSVVVGEAAERRALTDPDRVVREFKRRIGDPTPIVVGGRSWAPEELSARLVRWVVDRVAEREGGPADQIAVTHPASWGAHKKDLLAAALAGQGLTVTFLAEPQAAALHYAAAERIPAGSAIAVYDLGGGTFDAAVVRKGDPSAAGTAAAFELLGRPEGLERLGGVDFDEAVFEHVREGLPAAFADLDETDSAILSAVARVRRECTEAKEALSSDTDVAVPVLMPAARGSVRLHRTEFEAMIRPHVEETVRALRKAVASAALEPEELTAVLLVGGSSRIPLVAQLVSEQLGLPVSVDADPKNAIAKGAALAVSPRPVPSWPGVVITPVQAGADTALAGAATGPVAALAAPARPPRPSLAPYDPSAPSGETPPHGSAGTGSAAAALSRPADGPPHGPPTASPSAIGPQPPKPGSRKPGWEKGPTPAAPRPLGLLVGIGSALAAAAVVAGLLLSHSTPSSAQIGTNSGTGEAVTTEVGEASVPVVPEAEIGTGGGEVAGTGGPTGNGAPGRAPAGGDGGGAAPADGTGNPGRGGGGGTPPSAVVVDPPLPGGPSVVVPPPIITTTVPTTTIPLPPPSTEPPPPPPSSQPPPPSPTSQPAPSTASPPPGSSASGPTTPPGSGIRPGGGTSGAGTPSAGGSPSGGGTPSAGGGTPSGAGTPSGGGTAPGGATGTPAGEPVTTSEGATFPVV